MPNLPAEACTPGYGLPRTSGRARSTGLLITVLLHLLVLALLLLRPGLREKPATAAERPTVTFLTLTPARVEKPAPPPLPVATPQPSPRQSKPRRARPTVQAPAPAPSESPTEAVAESEPPVAPQSSPATDAAVSAPAPAAGGSDQPDCVPIPYGWLARVAQTISSEQHYPGMSRQLGERGTAYVRLNLDRSGAVLRAPLLRSSGYGHLDEEAQDVMRRIGSFGRVPDSACPGRRVIVIDQPVSFSGR